MKRLGHLVTGCDTFFQSPNRNVARQAQTMTTEMNRRAKFLTVEGIQKRKNPDKNYVSKIVFFYLINES